jgi:outer membrane protein OmpA-like peptidoglycan-associated protein
VSARPRRFAALAALLATAAFAQAPTTTMPLGQWTLNPGAERSQVLATGELLGPGRFRVALLTHGLLTPVDGTPGSIQQLREHVLAAVGLHKRFELTAQVPILIAQQPAPNPAQGLARPWITGRIGLLAPEADEGSWVSLDLGLGIPGLGQAELTPDPPGPVGSAKVSLGVPFAKGLFGLEAELRASQTRVDLRGGLTMVGTGIHLKGELAVRGDVSLATPRGFVEVLGGIRYVLRPVELSLLVGPGYGLATTGGFDFRAVGGIGFVSPQPDEEEQRQREVDCTEGTDYRLQDCPNLDWDGDGIVNAKDRCPKEFGPKENHGCPWPDTDGDGLTDDEDACPTVPGPPDNYGCPPNTKQLVIVRRDRLEILDKVFFEFDKATIKEESFGLLDQVAAVITSHPELTKIRVEGHTDKVGSAEYNRKLSRDRANAVKEYLIGKGVDAGRLTTAGFGFDRPIATNDTDEGRSKNRRVEFIIVREAEPEEAETPIDDHSAPEKLKGPKEEKPSGEDEAPPAE